MTDDARHRHPARRTVLVASAWAMPVIASTFVPALAQSAQSRGSVPASKVRVSPDFLAADADRYDPATGVNRGPIVVYVRARYDQNIVWWPTPDPSVATVPYVVQVSGPLGTSTLTGAVTIPIGGYAQQERWYPGPNDFPIPAGTYTFTLTLFGSDGSTSASTSVTVS